MKPALSVIFFTVCSGAGLGLMLLAILLALSGTLADDQIAFAGVISGLVLTTIGLLSSTLHLANPKNAWRAFSRFKSSWLSREAIFALLLYPLTLLYLAGLWFDGTGSWLVVLSGVAIIVLALATLFATGMIYACLRTIPQWNTALVPVKYVLLGVTPGALLLAFIVVAGHARPAPAIVILCMVLLLLAALGKASYYLWIGKPQGPTINTATGFTRAGVKLLDIGHSGGTFNTREFGFSVAPEQLYYLRLSVFVLSFLLPAGFGFFVLQTGSVLAALLTVAIALGGLLIERWLFFVEARHTVNLFHGRQHC
jgi:DMSO reductase anchor subunit